MSSKKNGGDPEVLHSAVDDLVSQTAAQLPNLTANELERVTEVFKLYETGLREATIYPKDLAVAMKKLGLNPTETEIQDLINEIEVNGLIYYPAFCRVIMRKLREDDEENFHQELFRTLVGPKPYNPGNQATFYNVNKEYLSLEQFTQIMTNLPESVKEEDARDMFAVADRDGNGRISYKEFRRMCVVPNLEPVPAADGGAAAAARGKEKKATEVRMERQGAAATAKVVNGLEDDVSRQMQKKQMVVMTK